MVDGRRDKDRAMTVLHVPLHLPVGQAQRFLTQELTFRSVTSVKVGGGMLVIEHQYLTEEDKADLVKDVA